MLSLSQNTKYEVIKTFNLTSRYLDDLLTIDKIVHQINTAEFQLNMDNVSDTEVFFIRWFIGIKIYNQRDDFDLVIADFSLLYGDVPRFTYYDVFIFQLIRFPRVFYLVDDLVVIMFRQQNFSDKLIDIINFVKHIKIFSTIFRLSV